MRGIRTIRLWLRWALFRTARIVAVVYGRLVVPRRSAAGRRGMALMWAMVVFAVLSVTVMDFLNETRVNYALSMNQADGMKAYFNARSSVELQKMGLLFQNELEKDPFLGKMVTKANFQVWQVMNLILPLLSSGQLDTAFGSIQLLDDEDGPPFEGDYTYPGKIGFTRPDPEEGKINLNAFAQQKVDSDLLLRFCNMLAPPQWDDSLHLPDTKRLEERFKVIAHIIDYVDPDDERTVIDGHCKVSHGSGSGEDRAYRDLDYQAKNQALTTIEELRLVPGVTDAFMRRFKHELTVYPIADNALYINQADAIALLGFLCANFKGADSEGGYSPCENPNTSRQVARIALALDGYIKFFQNPLNVLAFYMGGLGGIGTSEGRLAAGMGLGQMQAFRRPQQLAMIIQAIMSNPQFEYFFITRADRSTAKDFGLEEPIENAKNGMLNGYTILPQSFDFQRMAANISTSTPKVFALTAKGTSHNITRHIRTVVDVSDAKPMTLYWREY